MPRLRQNDRERAVGMVQAGMTLQAVVDHFLSRITILRLMIRPRQTGRTNGRPRVTSQRQDRHVFLIHCRNRMITAEDTTRRTFGLANAVRRRLRGSGQQARRLVVERILKHHHRIARPAWARGRRRLRLYTWQHIPFSDESQCSLRFSDRRYRVYRRRGNGFTDQCVYESDCCFGVGSIMVWADICHDDRTQLKIVQASNPCIVSFVD